MQEMNILSDSSTTSSECQKELKRNDKKYE